MAAHHPGDEHLMAYAAGDLAEAPGLLVATHLALCPACRRQVADYEALGGQLLDGLAEEPLSEGSLNQTLARLDGVLPEKPKTASSGPSATGAVLPEPLRGYLTQASAANTIWRKAMPGLRTLKLEAEGAKVWLMEIEPGRPIPHHGHTGSEMVLVLSGGYHDGPAGYRPGDVHLSGPEIVHEPVADEGVPCLCLVVIDGSIRPTSLLGRIVSRLFGY
jgi:putative transcriptional regulator